MPVLERLRGWFRSRGVAGALVSDPPDEDRIDAVVRAHGQWIALLGAILEREQVISAAELSRSLRDFAAITASERPPEGRILALWASYLRDGVAAGEGKHSTH